MACLPTTDCGGTIAVQENMDPQQGGDLDGAHVVSTIDGMWIKVVL